MSIPAGVQPALLRQATYGSLRIGMYEPLKEALMGGSTAAPSVLHKLVAGVTSGALASGLCNPTDVVKVRMQAQATGAPRYRHVFHAFSTIASEEGVVRGLYRGVGPTMQRAAVVAGVELASYDECKGALVRWAGLRESAYATHFSASLLGEARGGGVGEGLCLTAPTPYPRRSPPPAAGFLATLASSPLDVVKSRVMNQPVDPATGRGTLYASTADCFRKAVAAEGVLSLWKGFGPNFARIGPHVVITFMTIERLRLWFAPRPPTAA